jgi:hypothetical protein
MPDNMPLCPLSFSSHIVPAGTSGPVQIQPTGGSVQVEIMNSTSPCLGDKCAWWVVATARQREDSGSLGKCAIIDLLKRLGG